MTCAVLLSLAAIPDLFSPVIKHEDWWLWLLNCNFSQKRQASTPTHSILCRLRWHCFMSMCVFPGVCYAPKRNIELHLVQSAGLYCFTDSILVLKSISIIGYLSMTYQMNKSSNRDNLGFYLPPIIQKTKTFNQTYIINSENVWNGLRGKMNNFAPNCSGLLQDQTKKHNEI